MLFYEFLVVIGLMTGQHHGMAPGMSFDQSAAVHHFLIERSGGTIAISVKQATDEETRSAIRGHLKMIADDFKRGDFSSPFATHGEVPPGVKDMQRFRKDLRYTYEETPDGGRLAIRSGNPRAIAAVHQFLAYQIRAHKTGDPIPVK